MKTASDDADTLSLAHESNTSIDLPDGESITTSTLDGRKFDFDFEIINTAAYRKVFRKARSKLRLEKGSAVYTPPHAPASSGASVSETVGLPSLNAHAVVHPVVASQESEPVSSRPNASSRGIRSHSVHPKDFAEATGDDTRGMPEEENDTDSENDADPAIDIDLENDADQEDDTGLENDADPAIDIDLENDADQEDDTGLENDADPENGTDTEDQPQSTSKESELRLGGYSVGTTIGIGRKGKVMLAWKKDHSHHFAVKFIRHEPDAFGTGLPRNTLRGFMELKRLSHPNIIRLHDMFATDSYSAVVLEYIPGGSLAEYIAEHTRLNTYISQRFFAQIISAVGYLHRNGIVNPTLSCSKVLLDYNLKATLTGFSNVKPFKIKEIPRIIMGNFTEVYCPDREESPRFDGAREADVRSCGIILVSTQYGLILDINDMKYFMLAGDLHSAALVKPPGCDAQLQLNSSSCTALTFPEYFPNGPKDLVQRMLAEQFPAQVTLRDVAQHNWLSDHAHIVKDIIEKPIVSFSPLGFFSLY